MNFLKNVAKQIQSGIESNKYDLIVDRRVRDFEQHLSDLAQNRQKDFTAAEIASVEEEFVNLCLREYDEEASQYAHRPVAADWNEGGGDIMEVRKRMLFRELQARKGGLEKAIRSFDEVVTNLRAKCFDMIRREETVVRESLPCLEVTLDRHSDRFRDKLRETIVPSLPGGFEDLNRRSNNELKKALDESRTRLRAENEVLVKKAIDNVSQQELDDFNGKLRKTIKSFSQTSKRNVSDEDVCSTPASRNVRGACQDDDTEEEVEAEDDEATRDANEFQAFITRASRDQVRTQMDKVISACLQNIPAKGCRFAQK